MCFEDVFSLQSQYTRDRGLVLSVRSREREPKSKIHAIIGDHPADIGKCYTGNHGKPPAAWPRNEKGEIGFQDGNQVSERSMTAKQSGGDYVRHVI